MLGASADPVELNQKFSDKNSYNYPLLSDPEQTLIKALGIQMAGRPLAQRITFVIDRKGQIVKIYDKVSPKGHADEVLAFVKQLNSK